MAASKVFSSIGKRKTSIARVILKDGSGQLTINKRTLDDYFKRPSSKLVIEQPLKLSDLLGKIDVRVNVVGGGLSGQAGAIRHGIARALLGYNPDLRPVLKSAGLLTRDSRKKERKMYGLKAARARYQYSKR